MLWSCCYFCLEISWKSLVCVKRKNDKTKRGSHSVARMPQIIHIKMKIPLPCILCRRTESCSEFPFIGCHVEQLRVFCIAWFAVLGETSASWRHASWSRGRYRSPRSRGCLRTIITIN